MNVWLRIQLCLIFNPRRSLHCYMYYRESFWLCGSSADIDFQIRWFDGRLTFSNLKGGNGNWNNIGEAAEVRIPLVQEAAEVFQVLNKRA